jgi:hypothetical protein
MAILSASKKIIGQRFKKNLSNTWHAFQHFSSKKKHILGKL